MHNRLRLLRLVTAVLYFGPLLAGLIGQGWGMVPVFVGIFLLWSVILRPHLWPATVADLARSEAWVAAASLIATQILLVVVCFAVGRGLGGVLGVMPAVPAYLPATLSFLSVPLSRLIWNPRVAAENTGFDPVMHDVAVPDDAVRAVDTSALAAEMLAVVLALPEDVGEAELQQHLSAISAHVDPVAIRQTLGDAVAARRANRVGVKALIIHATDPALSNLMSGSAYVAQAFAAAGRDAELLALFARRCVMALEDEPDLATDCPSVDQIARAAQEVSDSVASAGLNRLVGLLDQNNPARSFAR